MVLVWLEQWNNPPQETTETSDTTSVMNLCERDICIVFKYRLPILFDIYDEPFKKRCISSDPWKLGVTGFEIKYILYSSKFENFDQFKSAVAYEFLISGLSLPSKLQPMDMVPFRESTQWWLCRDVIENPFNHYPGVMFEDTDGMSFVYDVLYF